MPKGFNGPYEERRQVPPHTWCAECRLVVAPYAEHVRFRGKTFHTSCFYHWWRRRKSEAKLVRLVG
jgi:hypothetical protein